MWVRALFIAILVATPSSRTLSQSGGGPSGRGGLSHSARESMREIHEATPNREILGLLFHEPVRKEIKFSDESFETFKNGMKASFDTMRTLWSEEREGKITREQRQARVLQAMKTMDEQSRKLLDEPQFDRLLGLYVQHLGVAAAENAEVARRINLAGSDLEEFRRSRSHIRKELIEMNQSRMDRILRSRNENTPKNLESLFAEIEASVNERLSTELSEPQRIALKNLEGASFADLPPPRIGWGPRPGAPGGGGRGGRDRGRSDGHERSHPDSEGGGRRGGSVPTEKSPSAPQFLEMGF